MSDSSWQIRELLRSTKRRDIENLIDYLNRRGFFTSPASRDFHGSFIGGLASHSMRVYQHLYEFHFRFAFSGVTIENLIIAALLHDVCKIGAYTGTFGNYSHNPDKPEGHANLSIERIIDFTYLEPMETFMIRYHMGPYGLEHDIKELKEMWADYPVVKFMYFADELAAAEGL